MIYRQGEVLLVKIAELPENLTKKDNILARGEVTGHAHRMTGTAQVLTDGTQQFVVVAASDAILQHEEHKPIMLPEGNYKVVIQQEYDLVRDQVRQVTD